MCKPGADTLANIGMYSSVVGTTSSALGGIANSINTRRVANANAVLADQQAADAVARGASNEFNARLKTAQLKGTQVAGMAANGVALYEGSPLDVLTSTDIMGAVDANTIRDNAARDAYGYKVQAANERAQAAVANPWATGFTSLIGGSAKVAERWYKWNKQIEDPTGG